MRGLQDGADDYLVKPFAFSELLARSARCCAAARPAAAKRHARCAVADLRSTWSAARRPRRAAARPDGQGVRAAPLLLRRRGQILSRTDDRRAGLGHELRQRHQRRRGRRPPAAREDRRPVRDASCCTPCAAWATCWRARHVNEARRSTCSRSVAARLSARWRCATLAMLGAGCRGTRCYVARSAQCCCTSSSARDWKPQHRARAARSSCWRRTQRPTAVLARRAEPTRRRPRTGGYAVLAQPTPRSQYRDRRSTLRCDGRAQARAATSQSTRRPLAGNQLQARYHDGLPRTTRKLGQTLGADPGRRRRWPLARWSALGAWLARAAQLRPLQRWRRRRAHLAAAGSPAAGARRSGRRAAALGQQFNALMDRLKRAYKQLEGFNADVAHELRTPLATLIGETEVALRASARPRRCARRCSPTWRSCSACRRWSTTCCSCRTPTRARRRGAPSAASRCASRGRVPRGDAGRGAA